MQRRRAAPLSHSLRCGDGDSPRCIPFPSRSSRRLPCLSAVDDNLHDQLLTKRRFQSGWSYNCTLTRISSTLARYEVDLRSLKRQLKRSINGPASGPPVARSLNFGPRYIFLCCSLVPSADEGSGTGGFGNRVTTGPPGWPGAPGMGKEQRDKCVKHEMSVLSSGPSQSPSSSRPLRCLCADMALVADTVEGEWWRAP